MTGRDGKPTFACSAPVNSATGDHNYSRTHIIRRRHAVVAVELSETCGTKVIIGSKQARDSSLRTVTHRL